MTEQDLRVKIAEAKGWTDFDSIGPYLFGHSPERGGGWRGF